MDNLLEIKRRVDKNLSNLKIDTKELFDIPITFDNRFLLVDLVQKSGWSLIDGANSGNYSRVLVKDNLALKISCDIAYLKYLEFTENYQYSVFPKIISKPIIGNGLYVVISERLQPLDITTYKPSF